MSNATSATISWNLQLSVNPGKLEEFRSLMHEMVNSTRGEEGCLSYEWFLSDDGSVCHLNERYADSDATLTHLGIFGSKFAERFMACVTPTGVTVYGSPSDQLRGALEPFGAAYLGPFGGFTAR